MAAVDNNPIHFPFQSKASKGVQGRFNRIDANQWVDSHCSRENLYRFATAQTGGDIKFNLRFRQGWPVNLDEGI